MKRKKVRKPTILFRSNKHTHGFFLERHGYVTCECDPLMTFASNYKDAKKIGEWFLKVADYLKDKREKQ